MKEAAKVSCATLLLLLLAPSPSSSRSDSSSEEEVVEQLPSADSESVSLLRPAHTK
jgi:hypothetical protein